MICTGPTNLITDVSGLLVGNSEDHHIKSGATVVTAHRPFTAAVHVMGGAPGTRETDLLSPENTVQQVDAIVLSGGSALGLTAASSVADALRKEGRGFAVGDQRVPIVPAAILFDLLNGGDKDWAVNPYSSLGKTALTNAAQEFALGTAGAGTGATTATLKGGLGSASAILPTGQTVGALVAVNAFGSATVGAGPQFWAAPFEMEGEFGGMGVAQNFNATGLPKTKGAEQKNTTIAVVATDAKLSQAQTKRLSIAAHDGMARALFPSHTPMDGDLVFGVSTGDLSKEVTDSELCLIGHVASLCLARAIARGVFLAQQAPNDVLPTWKKKFR